jgi:hypothetical protein
MKLSHAFTLLIFVVPFILLSSPGVSAGFGRIVATSIFIFGMTIGVFWYGLNPKTKMIRGGKLSQPQYDSVRPTIERNLRILVVLFGLFACVYLTFPWAADMARLAGGEKPLKVTGTVEYKSVPLFGLWFMEQTVRVSRKLSPNLFLYYSFTPLHVGEAYDFLVLPRSRVIIDFAHR